MKSDLSSFGARLRARIADYPAGSPVFPFNDLALELFALQFEANPAYRRLCEARRATPLTLSQWSDIPSVPTAAFKELELTCLAPEQRTRVFHSSGTTEQRPSRHFHNAESLATYEASLWAGFTASGLCTGYQAVGHDRLIILTPAPAAAPHSSLVHMFDTVRQKLAANDDAFHGKVGTDGAWELNLPSIVSRLEVAAADTRPVLVLGTAFSFVHLLDHLTETGRQFKLPAGSRVMETGGYKGRVREIPKTELHGRLAAVLGVSRRAIISEYGMSELSSQAYDAPPAPGDHGDPAGGCFRFPPWARAQIISPETGREVSEGETGLIRVFDLANVASVLAVQTADLGIRRGEGFELLGRAALAEPRGCSLMAV